MAHSTPVIENLIKYKYSGWEGYCNLHLKKPSDHKIIKNFLPKVDCDKFVENININNLQEPDIKRRKIGFNGNDSIFRYLNYFDFPRPLKQIYKDIIPDKLINDSLESWIMYFDTNNFYDLWFAPETCLHYIYSISLLDKQIFEIDYKSITVNKGDLVIFETRIPHEVPLVNKPNMFLNFLLLRNNT